jgi:hypothetical protein
MDTGLGSLTATTNASPTSTKLLKSKKAYSPVRSITNNDKLMSRSEPQDLTTSNDDDDEDRGDSSPTDLHMLRIKFKAAAELMNSAEENSYSSEIMRMNSISSTDTSIKNGDFCRNENNLEQNSYFNRFSRVEKSERGLMDKSVLNCVQDDVTHLESNDENSNTLASSDTETIKTEDFLESFNKCRFGEFYYIIYTKFYQYFK